MNRAQKMLEVLRDGQPHSRRELFERCGFFLTNNAAAELREQGYGVEHKVERNHNGEQIHCYRLLSLNESDGTNGIPLDSAGSESSLSLSESLPERGGVGAAAMSGSRTSEPERPLSESELVPLFEVPEPQDRPAWA